MDDIGGVLAGPGRVVPGATVTAHPELTFIVLSPATSSEVAGRSCPSKGVSRREASTGVKPVKGRLGKSPVGVDAGREGMPGLAGGGTVGDSQVVVKGSMTGRVWVVTRDVA
jgi:hypothetical protein